MKRFMEAGADPRATDAPAPPSRAISTTATLRCWPRPCGGITSGSASAWAVRRRTEVVTHAALARHSRGSGNPVTLLSVAAWASAIALAGLAGVASANEPTACYARTYDAAHMAAHPGQQVREIRARALPNLDTAQTDYDIRVRLRDDTREFRIQSGCGVATGELECIVECDGGVMRPSQQRNGSLRIETPYLRAEAGAGSTGEAAGCALPATRNIADQAADGSGVDTVFVLHPRDRSACGD